MKILLALLKREVLENSSIWKVPLIMLVIGLLIKASMSFGSLAIEVNVTDVMDIDASLNSAVDGVVNKAVHSSLWLINGLVTLVMVLVSVFYALSCLYTERQDQSILFWRSLPISDGMTVASKLLIALVLIPFLIVFCHLILSILFLGGQSVDALKSFIQVSVLSTVQITLWLLIPLVAWCLLCSEVAKKTPFLLAFIAPLILFSVDGLFLSTGISDLVLDRFYLKNHNSLTLLFTGLGFSVVCVFIATVKRSQRI